MLYEQPSDRSSSGAYLLTVGSPLVQLRTHISLQEVRGYPSYENSIGRVGPFKCGSYGLNS